MRPPPLRGDNDNDAMTRRRSRVVLTHLVRTSTRDDAASPSRSSRPHPRPPSESTHRQDSDGVSPRPSTYDGDAAPSSRPHPPRTSLHTRRRRRLALVASSPTSSLRVHPPAGRRRRLVSPLRIRRRRRRPRLALTHLVRPSTRGDDGASPSSCPSVCDNSDDDAASPCPHRVLTLLPPHTGRTMTVPRLVPPHTTTTTVPSSHPLPPRTYLHSTHGDDSTSPSRCPHPLHHACERARAQTQTRHSRAHERIQFHVHANARFIEANSHTCIHSSRYYNNKFTFQNGHDHLKMVGRWSGDGPERGKCALEASCNAQESRWTNKETGRK